MTVLSGFMTLPDQTCAVVSRRKRSNSSRLNKGRLVAREGWSKPRWTKRSSVAGLCEIRCAASTRVKANFGSGWLSAAESRYFVLI